MKHKDRIHPYRFQVITMLLCLLWCSQLLYGQPGGEDKKQTTPKVFQSITKPKKIEQKQKTTLRKTIPVTPSMKIPPHFPHPPVGTRLPKQERKPLGSPSERIKSKTEQTKAKTKETKTKETKIPTPSAPKGVGGGVKSPYPAAEPTQQPQQPPLVLPPEEEFELGLKYKKIPRKFKFSFNIRDYDLSELVSAIAKITGKRFILGHKVKQNIKATIISPKPVTAGEAYRAFLSVLQINGLTVIPEGKFLKIVDSTGAASLAVPTYINQKKAPAGDKIITRIQQLQYGNAEEFSAILNKFKSKQGDITAYRPTNSLIITDYTSNIRRLDKIISALDVPGAGEKIWVEPIHYADAVELAGKIQEVMEAAGMGGEATKRGGKKATVHKPYKPTPPASPGQHRTYEKGEEEIRVSKIIPEERTNSLIIVATKSAYLRIMELIKKLDVEIPGEGEIHVLYLQHADAEQLANTLSSLTSGVRGRRGKGKGGAGVEVGELFEGQVKITSDKATNSLVIISTTRDYANIRKVIEKLDIPRRQVFVEAIIMEVTLQKMKTLGIATNAGTAFKTGEKHSLLFGATTFSGLSTIIVDPTSLMGLAVGLRGPEISEAEGILGTGISIPAFGVIVNALQTNNDVNILSTPNILATDNEQAEITVGGNVPIQQGFGGWGALSALSGGQTGAGAGIAGAGALAGLGYGLGPMVSVGRQNVGLTLRITPHINESNQIRLEIELEISEVTGETPLGPLIDQRMAKTVSVVKDQQTVVLGGLITDNQTETIDKVPILGDIPVIGYLFKKKKTRTTKRNLLIFLTPYIIRDATDFRTIFNRKMEERREFIEMMTAFETREYKPFIDYTKTDGIIEEIHKTLLEIEQQEAIMRESMLKPPPEHKPSAPVEPMQFEENKTDQPHDTDRE